jgi:hypothetical protein
VYPGPHYRFTKRKWADELLQFGKLRLQLQTAYHDTGRHETGVADPNEGRTAVERHIGLATGADLPEAERRRLGLGTDVTIAMSRLVTVHRAPPAYIYCLAMAEDWSCAPSAERDTCIIIPDLRRFQFFLDRFMLASGYVAAGTQPRYQPVEYRPGSAFMAGEQRSGALFVKDSSFAHQQEFRLAYFAAGAAPHVDVEEPELAKHCELLKER